MLDEFVREGLGSKFSRDNVKIWAREAANSLVNENISLNEKIAQIADSNGLNEEQIQRLVEAANLAVDAIRKGSDFDVARTSSILAMLKRKPEFLSNNIEDEDSFSDYLSPPIKTSPDIDLNEMFGVKPQETGIPQKKIIQIRIIKLANAQKSILDHMINLNFKKTEAEKELVKVAKQCVMQNNESIKDLYNICVEGGFQKLANQYFPIINHVLVGQGVIEKTAFQAPEELISDTLNENGIPNIRVVNGNHAILKSFDTISRINDDIVHARRAIVVTDDKIKKLREEVKRIS